MKREEIKIKSCGTKEFPFYQVMIGRKEFCSTNSEDNAKVIVKYLLSHLSQLIEKTSLPPAEGAEQAEIIIDDWFHEYCEGRCEKSEMIAKLMEFACQYKPQSTAESTIAKTETDTGHLIDMPDLNGEFATQQQPTAEGAEEILRRIADQSKTEFKRDFVWFPEAIVAMQDFATLHARKIADKMVSERLREELIEYELSFKDGELAVGLVDEYLKSREQ